jgi:TonB family protein
MNQAAIGYGCIVLSVAVHAGAMLGASRPALAVAPPVRTVVELALLPPPPLRPPPAPAPEPTAPALKPKSAPRVATTREAPAPPATPRPEASPTPELSGNTLLGEGEASWSAPAGNGAEREGPIQVGAPVALPVAASVRPAPTAVPALAVEPLAQLSRKPVPPALAAALERNYPSGARRQGKSGEAKVRALIDALGRVASVTIHFESAPEFGAACKKTLLQSQWTAPLGQLGKPTATFVTYRCTFRVDD